MTTTDPSTPGVLPRGRPELPPVHGRQPVRARPDRPAVRGHAGRPPARREVRHDPVACADHLQGVMAAHGITDLVDRGRRLAAPHLAAADEALDQLTAANLRLEAAADRRRNLPDEVVDAPPIRAGRAAIRRQLAQNQHVAAQRELAGDLEHRQTGSPGWTGWVVAGIVAVIETVVTLRIFNVDLTDLTWTAVPWLALSGGLVLFNHQVAGYLGEKRRAARETRDAAIRLNTNGFHGFHEHPGTARHRRPETRMDQAGSPGSPRRPRRSAIPDGPSGWPWRSTGCRSGCSWPGSTCGCSRPPAGCGPRRLRLCLPADRRRGARVPAVGADRRAVLAGQRPR